VIFDFFCDFLIFLVILFFIFFESRCTRFFRVLYPSNVTVVEIRKGKKTTTTKNILKRHINNCLTKYEYNLRKLEALKKLKIIIRNL